MRIISFIAILAGIVGFLTGCELRQTAERLKPPVIIDTSAPWRVGRMQVLTARVDTSSAWEIVDVYVRHTRHFWPGPAEAHESRAQRSGPVGTTAFLAVPDEALGAPTADHMFYQWFVDYRLKAGGSEILTARSERQDFVINCSQAETDLTLRVLQDLARPVLTTPDPVRDLQLKEYFAVSHLFSSLSGNGVTFSHSSVATKPNTISVTHLRSAMPEGILNLLTAGETNVIGLPKLAFYAPRPLLPGEPITRITEPNRPDPPYTLIGGGHVRSHTSATRRPSLGCIPSSEWFVHEAGYHLQTGQMLLRPPPEARPGARATTEMIPPVNGFAGPLPANMLLWHPRFWDLHIWYAPAGSNALPTLSILSPTPVPGVNPCPDRPLAACTAAIFFYPATWE